MASVQEAIRRLIYRYSVEGAEKVIAANQNIAATSELSAKAALSLEKQFGGLERRYNSTLRAQQDYEKVQRQVNAAVAQNPALLERGNAILAQAAAHYGQAGVAAKAFAAATSGVSGQLIALSAGAGPVGVFLSALGPWGIAGAVGIGIATKALTAMVDVSHALAEKAQELRRFSEVTGLTTAQVQALRSEASKFGVTSDEAQSAIQNFTARFNDLRLGQGELLTQIRRVNPALADQMQVTTNAGDALTLFGQALAKVDDVFQRNALVKAATGKGGLANAQFLQNLNVDAVTKSYVDAGKALDDGLIKRLAQLEIDINKTSQASKKALASIFAEGTLEAQLAYEKSWLDFATSVKNFSLSGDLRFLLETVLKVKFGGAGTLLGAMGIDREFGYKAPARSQGGGFDESGFGFYRSTGPADLNDPGRKEVPKTLEAQAEALKKINEVMGSATTFSQHYNAALADLNVKAKDAGVAQNSLTYQIAKGALDLDLATKTTAALNGILGAAATVQDQYKARLQQIAKAQMEGAGATDAQVANAKRLAMAQADGTFQLQAQIDATKLQTATIGMTVAKAEEFSLIQTKINENLNAGRPALDGVTESYRRMAAEQGKARQNGELEVALDQAKFEARTALLSPLEKEIALLQKRYGITQQTQEIANLKRQTELIKEIGDTTRMLGGEIGKSVIDPLLDGKNIFDSMNDSAKQLTKTLANAALKDFMSGNWEKAIIETLAAAVIKAGEFLKKAPEWLKIAVGVVSPLTLLGSMGQSAEEKALEEAQKKFAGMTNEVNNFIDAASGFDLSPFVSAIQQIESTTLNLVQAAVAAGEFGKAVQLIFSAVAQVNNQVDQFIKPKDNSVASQIAQVNNEAQQLIGELNNLNTQYGLGLNRTNDILAGAADRIAEIQRKAQEEIEKRILSFQDRAFNAANDNTTLEGQLAALHRQQQRDLVEEEELGGEARLDALAAFQAEEIALRKSFADKAIEQAKRLAEAAAEFRRSIQTYLDGLRGGSQSTAAPQDRYNDAKAAFERQLALAQNAGPEQQAARASITQYSDAFIAASRDFNASNATFQTDRQRILDTLAALPDAISINPVVDAVALVQDAIETQTSQQVARLDTSITRLDSTITELAANNTLSTAISSSATRIVNAINALGSNAAGIGGDHSQHFNNIEALLIAGFNIGGSPGGSGTWSWLGFQRGGMIPSYQDGGMIGNGIYNRDSVLARYAGGGSFVGLAGGEWITPAPSVNPSTLPTLQYIRETGRAPSNDNGEHFDRLATRLERAIVGGVMAQLAAEREENAKLRAELASVKKAIADNKPPARRPGTAAAA